MGALIKERWLLDSINVCLVWNKDILQEIKRKLLGSYVGGRPIPCKLHHGYRNNPNK